MPFFVSTLSKLSFFARNWSFRNQPRTLRADHQLERGLGSRLGPVEWFKTLTMEDRTRYVSGMGSGKIVDGNMCIIIDLPHTSGRLTQRYNHPPPNPHQ